MAYYTFGVPPFQTTTFTAPVAGTHDVIVTSSPANFTINGNGGNDVVDTANGNDTITTGAGRDVIAAGSGNNTISAGNGANVVTAGNGDDTVTTGTGIDVVSVGHGNNTVTTGGGADVVNTGAGNDIISAGSGNDIVSARNGNDVVNAGSGNDLIHAGGGNDSVNAGTGNDRISAGGGLDSLTGGGGHDTFVYSRLADAMLGADVVSDFSTASPANLTEGDVLDLRNLVGDFTGLPALTLANLVASGHLSFSGTSGATVISFDSNGDAALGDRGVLMTLNGVGFTSESASRLAFNDNIVVD